MHKSSSWMRIKFAIMYEYLCRGSRALLKPLLILSVTLSGVVFSAPLVLASISQDAQLAHMVVLNKYKQPLQGATVQIFVVPQQSYVATKHPLEGSGTDGVRGLVQQPLVGTGSTDTQGHINVALNPPSRNNKTLISVDGYVNYELRVLDNNGVWLLDYHFPRYYGDDTNRASETNTLQGKSLVANTSLTSISLQQIKPNGPAPTCGWRDTGHYWDSYTVVGELNTVPEMEAHFDYGQTADSNIGVEFSQSKDGGYSLSGTFHISNSNSGRVSQDIVSNNSGWGHQLLSSFHYVQQQRYCSGVPTSAYQVIPNIWNGGMVAGNDVYGNNNHRNQFYLGYGPGAGFTRNQNQAYTYGGTACIFICVTSQSGFATDVNESWKNNSRNATHYLYGSNAYPSFAPIVYASSN